MQMTPLIPTEKVLAQALNFYGLGGDRMEM